MKNGRVQRFCHAQILVGDELHEGELWVADGKIIPPQGDAHVEFDARGKIIAPGFIDLQINGGFGCDFSRNPEEIDKVAKSLFNI